jgi:hypothetical protein
MSASNQSNALDHVGPIFTRILRMGAVLVVALAIVGGVVGLLVAGTPGLVGGLIGAVMSVVFLGLTAASVLVGLRLSHGQMISGAFFGTVMGTFLVKFILFLVVLVSLKGQPWVDFRVLGLAIIVGVIGSLVIDMTVIARSRVPIDVPLPGSSDGDAPRDPAAPRNPED